MLRPNANPAVLSNPRQERAAVKIQAQVRGFFARKKYGIKSLPDRHLSSGLVFVVGNDPVMPESLGKYHEPNEKIALIGTSGMRVVSLACKLGNSKNTPKIVLIDCSINVYRFWYALREMVRDDKKAQSKELFLNNLPQFLVAHRQLCQNLPDDAYFQNQKQTGVKYLNQDKMTYFKALIQKYGYEYVRAVICQTVLIKQFWEDPAVLVKIKNILKYQQIDKIFVYPSNIVACAYDMSHRQQILKNIAQINPTLSIHTDRCAQDRVPKKVHLFADNAPNFVAHTLFGSEGAASLTHGNRDVGQFFEKLNAAIESQDIDKLISALSGLDSANLPVEVKVRMNYSSN